MSRTLLNHSALHYVSPMVYEQQHHELQRQHRAAKHGLPTGGACVARAAPPVENLHPRSSTTLENQVINRPCKRGNSRSATAKAIAYSLNRCTALTRDLGDGHLPADNN